jgi:hypothetical protein
MAHPDRDRALATAAARRGLDEVIARAAREVYGPASSADRPGARPAPEGPQVEALAGMRAAMLARDHAEARLREYAAQARTDGSEWGEIAERLCVAPTATQSAAVALFEHLVLGAPLTVRAQRPSWALSGPRLHWPCSRCTELIVDHGPYPGHHPDDGEDGHAPDCPRRAAKLHAFETDD